MHNYRHDRIVFSITILILTSLACNLFSRIRPTPVETAIIPITTEAADSLREDLSAAAQDLENEEQVTLIVKEAELTSLVALELQKLEDPFLHEPQIYLRDGQVQVFGKIQRGGLMVTSEIHLVVKADSAGHPQYEILSAKVGPVALPDSILDDISEQIDSVFTNRISSRLNDVYIESITIAGGVMTIQGYTR